MERIYITPDDIEEARRTIPVEFGPLGEQTYLDKYSRTKPDGTKEDWYETCARVVNGNLNFVPPEFVERDEPRKLYEAMLRMKIIPAGRHLWATGIGKQRQFIHNCHVADFTEHFTEHFEYTFLRLMEGGGVGANYSNRFIHSNPDHPDGYWIPNTDVELHLICDPSHPDIDFPIKVATVQRQDPAGKIQTVILGYEQYPGEIGYATLREMLSDTYSPHWQGDINGYTQILLPDGSTAYRRYMRVEDSREGWAEALKALLEAHLSGKGRVHLVIDISQIRPYQSIIKGFGGTASGPAALAVMLWRINRLLNDRIGQALTSLDYMQIDHAIAQAVIAGGTRRSARMSMKWWSDPDVLDFIACKKERVVSGVPVNDHWSTNISVVVDDSFFRAVRSGDPHAVRVLRSVAEGMLTNGEPGLFNASRAKDGESPIAEFYSTNPCVTADAIVVTDGAAVPVAELINKPFAVRHGGKLYQSAGFFSTGTKPVFRVRTKEGSSIRVTADHQLLCFEGHADAWMTVDQIRSRIESGGSVTVKIAYSHVDNVRGAQLPISGSKAEILAYLSENLIPRGDDRFMWVSDRETAERWKLLLNLLGIKSHIAYDKDAGEWSVQIGAADWKAVQDDRRLARLRRSFIPASGFRFETVESVTADGEEQVYDTQVLGIHRYVANGFVNHNCGEIAMFRYPHLPAFDVCCLGHVNLAFFDPEDTKGIEEAFRLMARFLVRATCAPVNDPRQQANIDYNRRIGVGFLGFHEWLANQGIRYSEAASNRRVRNQLARFKEVVDTAARRYASALRLREPIKKTTVAPTGTISLLPGVTSGLQPLIARHYIRRVRYPVNSGVLYEILESGDYDFLEDTTGRRIEYLGQGRWRYPEGDTIATREANVIVVAKAYEDISLRRLVDALGRHHRNGSEPDRDRLVSQAMDLLETQYELKITDFLRVQRMVQEYYADNAISITINVGESIESMDPAERERAIDELTKVILEYLPDLKGITLFPNRSMEGAPYEPLEYARYLEIVRNRDLRRIDNLAQECENGCPVV